MQIENCKFELNTRQPRQQSSLFSLFAAVRLILLTAVLCGTARAQCYVDPFTGRQVCTPTAPTIDASAYCRITLADGSTGSGTLAARDEKIGLVLTCAHLFDGSTANVIVSFSNGQRFAARLLDRDRAHDLAALAIRRPDVEPINVSSDDPNVRSIAVASN
jgi:S1-C subfamily serine protease